MTPHTTEGLEAVAIAALLIHGAIRSTTVAHIAGAPARAVRRRRARSTRATLSAQLRRELDRDLDPPAVDQAEPFPSTLAGMADELRKGTR